MSIYGWLSLLFFGLSPKNKKRSNLCVLCASAVNTGFSIDYHQSTIINPITISSQYSQN